MSKIEGIKARHGAVRGYYADQKGTDAHLDRSWLIEEVERLTSENKRLFAAHSLEMARADRLKQEVDRLEKRIKELESDMCAALSVLPLLPMSAERILRSRVFSDEGDRK